MPRVTIGALQIGTIPGDSQATLDKIVAWEAEIAASQCRLVVMPEAIIGGYPKGESFGTRLGFRTPAGRQAFADYFRGAIDREGPEVQALAAMSARTDASLVVGVIERAGSTLYCSAMFFTPERGLVGCHRKLMPTGTERLVWGQGDGSTLEVVETAVGRVAAAICWENHMPQLRSALYAKLPVIWAAPTVDDRDIWQCSMRHIAHEGRNFLVSACQFQPSPANLGVEVPEWAPDRDLIRGGSVIVDPLGDVLAGPLYGEEGLVRAEIDTDAVVGARYDFDVVGHYARPDVFSLRVDEAAKEPVTFER